MWELKSFKVAFLIGGLTVLLLFQTDSGRWLDDMIRRQALEYTPEKDAETRRKYLVNQEAVAAYENAKTSLDYLKLQIATGWQANNWKERDAAIKAAEKAIRAYKEAKEGR